jgi:hypothetical protein
MLKRDGAKRYAHTRRPLFFRTATKASVHYPEFAQRI